MTDNTELHRMLVDIRDRGIETARDVTWIKDGMERGQERMDGHAKDIAELNGRVSRMQGSSSVFGSLAGAIFGGLIAYITRTHT